MLGKGDPRGMNEFLVLLDLQPLAYQPVNTVLDVNLATLVTLKEFVEGTFFLLCLHLLCLAKMIYRVLCRNYAR